MITGIFVFIIPALIIGLIAYPLSLIPFTLPQAIPDAFNLLVSTIWLVADFLPFISAIFAIILFLLPAKYIRMLFDIFLWVISWIPMIGKKSEHPLTGHTIDLRRRANSNELDLRNGRVTTRRTLRDITAPR